MKTSALQQIIVPLGLLMGWFGSAAFRTNSQQPDNASRSAAQASLLGNRSGKAPTAQMAVLLDESKTYTDRLLSIAQFVPALPGEFLQRLQELSTFPKTTPRMDALTQLMEEWVQHDAKAAFTACEVLEDDAFRASARRRVIWAWSLQDPEAALEQARSLPKSHKQRVEFIQGIAHKLGKVSPRRALDILASEDVQPSGDFQKIYTALAKDDLNEAIARLANSNSPEVLKGVLRVWLRRDPSAAIKHLGTQKSLDGWEVMKAMKIILPGMPMDNPLEMCELFASNLPAATWRDVRKDFTQAWFAKEPKAVMKWVAAQEDDQVRDSMTEAISMALAKESPSEAFHYLIEQGQPWGISNAASKWAKEDWEAAYAHINAFEGSPRARAAAAGGLLSSLSPSMTAEHIHTLLTLAEVQKESLYLHQLLPRLEVSALGDLLESYPASMASAMQNYLPTLVEHDPESAVALASRFPEKERERSLAELTIKWAANDPGGTATWLATLPEGPTRTSAYRNYINVLARSYPEATSAWIENVPEDLKAQTVEEYAGVTIPQNPQVALAELLKHNSDNHKLITQAMAQYHLLEPDVARKRLTEFEGELREKIEQRFEINDAWPALGQ